MTLSSYLGLDEEVDYGSDTNVLGDEGTSSSSPVPKVQPLTALNPFAERGETTVPVAQHHATDTGECIITNPLDEQQNLIFQREESARRRAQTKMVIQNRSGYVFSIPDVEERLHQTEGRSLATWASASEGTSPKDIAFRQILHDSYLESFLTTQGQYKSHLESLDRGVLVRPIKGVPMLLFVGELPEEEDNQFIRWVYRKRHLSIMTALRASADVADVRLERKLRYEYYKLKARVQLRNRARYASDTPVAVGFDPVVQINPLPPRTISKKRSRSQGDPDHDVQKHLLRMGSPAEGVSRTPKTCLTPGTLATSRDTRIDHDDGFTSGVSPHGTVGSLTHRAASVVVDTPKEGQKKVFLELSSLRNTLCKTQSAFDATHARV